MIVAATVAAGFVFTVGFGIGAKFSRHYLDRLHEWDADRHVDVPMLATALNREAARADKYLRIARTVARRQTGPTTVRPRPMPTPRHLRRSPIPAYGNQRTL